MNYSNQFLTRHFKYKKNEREILFNASFNTIPNDMLYSEQNCEMEMILRNFKEPARHRHVPHYKTKCDNKRIVFFVKMCLHTLNKFYLGRYLN